MGNKEEISRLDSDAGSFERTKNDEINLYELWKVIVKRKVIIIGLFIVPLIGSAIYCKIAPRIYRLETYMKINIPTPANELSARLSRNNGELNEVIFKNNADDIEKVKITEMPGTTDKLKITIESRNYEALFKAPQQLISYIESIPENKILLNNVIVEQEKVQAAKKAEENLKMKLFKAIDRKIDLQLKEMEAKVNNMAALPVYYDPVTINLNSVNLKMEIFRLENKMRSNSNIQLTDESKDYKMIQLLEEPFVSKYPVAPNKRRIITMTGIVGLVLGVFLVFIVESFERMRIKEKS